MHKKLSFIISLILLFSSVMPITAHEACDVNLEDTLRQLNDAQEAFDDGDTNDALAIIEQVQAELTAVTAECTHPEDAVLETYQSGDGGISFAYPDTWSRTAISNEQILLATSDALLARISTGTPESLEPGDMATIVLVIPLESAGLGGLDFEMIVNEVFVPGITQSEGISEADELQPLESTTIDERTVYSVAYQIGENIRAQFNFYDYTTGPIPTIIWILGMNPIEEAETAQDMMTAIGESLTYDPAPARTPLDASEFDGVQDDSVEYPEQSRDHIEIGDDHEPYNSNPPTSGPHASHIPAGIYAETIPDENVIHNLEHGHIWLTYRDADDQEALEFLSEIQAQSPDWVVVTHRPDNDTRIAAAAWTRLLTLDELDEQQILAFIARFGNQAPESIPG